MYKKLKGIGLILLAGIVTCTGCGSKQIFVNKDEQYQLVSCSDSELVNDTFYVKEGSKFYQTYAASGTTSGKNGGLLWYAKEQSLIPSYYKGELLAYASEKSTLSEVSLERYKYIGKSVGITGGSFNSDGYYCFSAQNNTVKDTDAANVFANAKSSDIRIESINGEKITQNSVSEGGIILGLQEASTCEITYYAGTYYDTVEVAVDKIFLQSYETYTITDIETTKNGYMRINMPSDAKSGYYVVNGSGLFKYYAFKKGNENTADTDMNEAYYASAEEQIMAYSQQYVVSVPEITYKLKINVLYDKTSSVVDEAEIKAIVTSPDGTTYDMTDDGESVLNLTLDKAIAGKWKVNISPKELTVTDVSVESNGTGSDATSETFQYTIDEASSNIQFYCDYNGDKDAEIWGIVTNEAGESQNLEKKSNELELTTTYTYLPAGTYTITVYHYADTEITDVNYRNDADSITQEVITIEE